MKGREKEKEETERIDLVKGCSGREEKARRKWEKGSSAGRRGRQARVMKRW